MTALRAVKGMNDVLPYESACWKQIEETFAKCMHVAGFREIRTPIVESTPLYQRAIGEVTDVVEKEMYSFARHHDLLTLRPEGTAGVVRAFIEHKWSNVEALSRLYYMGPMFRAERPQRGRYRQFHQLGAEMFGDLGPASDAECIDLVFGFLQDIGIKDARVLINSIGSLESKINYRQTLLDYLRPKRKDLSEESQRRLDMNPLRILDSKDPKDKEIVHDAPKMTASLSPDDVAHFALLRRHLDSLKTPYLIDESLVRGLDYYTRTLFEIKGKTDQLGAGDTLAGGGRYDLLVEQLGGPKTPAFGFALGLERLLLTTKSLGRDAEKRATVQIYFAPLGAEAVSFCLPMAKKLRALGYVVDVDGREQSLKSQLRRANGMKAEFAIVIGDRELQDQSYVLKPLHPEQNGSDKHSTESLGAATYLEKTLPISEMISYIQTIFPLSHSHTKVASCLSDGNERSTSKGAP